MTFDQYANDDAAAIAAVRNSKRFDRMKMFRFPCKATKKKHFPSDGRLWVRQYDDDDDDEEEKEKKKHTQRTPYIIIRDNNYSAQQIDHDYLRWLLPYQVFYILFVFCNVNENGWVENGGDTCHMATATISQDLWKKKRKKNNATTTTTATTRKSERTEEKEA